MHAIFVTIQLKPGQADAFLPHIMKNAEAAPRDEPGCQSFTVLASTEDADRFHFFEVYTDEDALNTHRETPHFKAYQAATADMIADRSVQSGTVQDS